MRFVRRHMLSLLMLVPVVLVCVKLLVTPINAHVLVGFANPGGPIYKDSPERGWPWLYEQAAFQDAFDEITWPSCQTSNYGFSAWILLADLAVLSVPISLAATLAFWCSNRDGGKLRFSLSGLMVVITLIAASCAWWAHHAWQFRQEQKALAQLNESVRSYPAYDGPQWLRRLLPDDALKPFHHLALVYTTISPTNLDGTAKLPEEFIAVIPHLPHLRALSVENPYYILDDERAAKLRLAPDEIEQLDNLERFELFYRAADDETIRQIVQLPRLRALKVEASPLTDDGLKALCASRALELISLYGCSEVTDVGIDALYSIPSLQRLEIQECRKLTPEAFRRASEIPNLTVQHDLDAPEVSHFD